MQDAIFVEDLEVRYRTKKGTFVDAVRGLSFHVAPGEIVGFLGPNGAGKSSTLKALMGFLSPVAGRAEVLGWPAGSLEAKRHTGYLPEVALYYPFLTPLETLVLYGELQGLKGRSLREEAVRLLVSVGLEGSKDKQNRTLSKGMVQRVGIAQSLLGSPVLLILDEVTSGLDPIGRQELRNLLKERQREGATLFFSSHELSEVDMLCDRILLLNGGRLVEERRIPELRDQLRRYRISYLGTASMIGLADDWQELAPGSYVAKFGSKDEMLQAIERVQSSGGKLIDVVSEEGSLEDYFIEVIGRAA